MTAGMLPTRTKQCRAVVGPPAAPTEPGKQKKQKRVALLTDPFTFGVMKSSVPSGWIKSGVNVFRLVSLWAWMFRHCEAPGSLPLAETNMPLAASWLDGFSTFLFKNVLSETIEIWRDRKPNCKVSQVAIQVSVLTGNKAARQAYGMVIKPLGPSVPDCCAAHTPGLLVNQFGVVQSSRAVREDSSQCLSHCNDILNQWMCSRKQLCAH